MATPERFKQVWWQITVETAELKWVEWGLDYLLQGTKGIQTQTKPFQLYMKTWIYAKLLNILLMLKA